ncbi:MAG: hypothetical protein LC659_04565 [Myxococcales bacterium]|nr:hypothetical protein [Myxococcales bacterium]
MIVKEQHVATVVKEVSAGAEDPQHVASLVGAFMQIQPTVGHYVSAHSNELGLEGVVLTLLHASVMARAVELALGRRMRAIRFEDLDAAARMGDGRGLADEEPELAGYLEGNLDAKDPTLGDGKRDVALRVLAVVGRAFLEQS